MPPQLLGPPHFRRSTGDPKVLEIDHESLRKVIVLSFWNDHMEESGAASREFVDAIFEVTGTNPDLLA